jgi:DNA-binding transcriptional LysR family regulator
VGTPLSALERETGAQLVERGGGRVSLTPVGRELVEHTERILVELRAAEATQRHSVLIVREGEHLSPRIATAIAAVREVSARSWTTPRS